MRFFATQGRHVALIGVKFGMEEEIKGPLLRAKFHPHRCNVSPLRGEIPQNRPLSKLNTGKFALRAMLPVMIVWQLTLILRLVPMMKFRCICINRW